MNVARVLQNCVNLQTVFLLFLCANQFSFSKQPLNETHPLKYFKTSKNKYQNMNLQATHNNIIINPVDIKLQDLEEIDTLLLFRNHLQIFTDSANESKSYGNDMKLNKKVITKRNTVKLNKKRRRNDQMNKRNDIVLPKNQCYLCKSSTDIVSSIRSLNLTQKYKGIRIFYFSSESKQCKIRNFSAAIVLSYF